jgi:hypothetical protein
MDLYVGPLSALTIALHIVLYLKFIMDLYKGPQRTHTISLHIEL